MEIEISSKSTVAVEGRTTLEISIEIYRSPSEGTQSKSIVAQIEMYTWANIYVYLYVSDTKSEQNN